MKTILVVTLMLLGQEKPTQNTAEMTNLKVCEGEAHGYMTHKFPAEVERKIVFRSAACAQFLPGEPT